MDWVWNGSEVYIMTMFLFGLAIGLVIGYGLGLFIDDLDKRIKNGRR
jgi:NhaP-type Na+/H+ or K+/H+ antiporter